MSMARDLVYSFVNRTARTARQEIAAHPKDHNSYQAVEAGSEDDDRLHGLLNWVEDDRVHAEAEKLRERANEFAASDSDLVAGAMAAATRAAADSMDPYEHRDGRWVRKSDGKPVIL